MCKQIWFNNTLVKMFTEVLEQLLLIFLSNRRLKIWPPVRCMVLICNQLWHFLIFWLQRSSILKTLIREQLNVCPSLNATSYCCCFVVFGCWWPILIIDWESISVYHLIAIQDTIFLFFNIIFSKGGFCNMLLICKCLLWLCFFSTVWSYFQLKINNGSKLVLKFSSI